MTDKEYQEFIERMRLWTGPGDEEIAHDEADNLLCEMLRKLGYDEIVELYESINKWSA